MTTPRGAPELVSAQAAPETTVNEQIWRTEAGAGRFMVADRVTAPPGTCTSGAVYLIIATATGAFSGKEGQLAIAVGTNAASGWYYRTLGTIDEGVIAYVQDEDVEYKWSGSAFAIYNPGASAANPSATASDTAVNGSAATFMRSDGAPAIQKASSSVFGVVKVDGTTITAVGGVISAAGGGGGGGGAGSITASGYTINTGKLAGRTTASSGAIEEITPQSGLTLSSGNLDTAYLGVKAYNDGTQSISNSTDTVVTFNTNEFGSSSVHSTSSNTGRFVATVAGKWQFTYHIQWNGNSTGQRLVWLRVNGSTAVIGSRTALVPNGNNIVSTLTMDLSLSVSDYVEIIANQSSGGSLNTGILLATDAVYVNMASMRYIGA